MGGRERAKREGVALPAAKNYEVVFRPSLYPQREKKEASFHLYAAKKGGCGLYLVFSFVATEGHIVLQSVIYAPLPPPHYMTKNGEEDGHKRLLHFPLHSLHVCLAVEVLWLSRQLCNPRKLFLLNLVSVISGEMSREAQH